MKRALAVLGIFLLAMLSAAPAARPDALTSGRNAPEARGPVLPFGGALTARLASAQRTLNDSIAAAFRDVRDRQSRTAIVLILGLAFLYGVLHAVGPGHGKAVVAGYFVANRARWTSGIAMGSMISLIQGASAIALVGLLAVVLQWRQFDVLDRATLVEFVSYGLIAVLGAVMLYRAVSGRRHAHEEHGQDALSHEPRVLDRRLILAAGLTPCASAIIILLFSLANDALPVGIAAVASLSLGMAITVSTIGIATVVGRHAIVRLLDRVGFGAYRLEQGLAVAGALAILSVSGLMMMGAWARL